MTPLEGSPSPRVGAAQHGAEGGGASERHRLEGELIRLRRRIAQLERERADVDAFAAVAAHELMEPLVMIEVHASMLAVGDDADPAKSADEIGRAAARLRRLVETVLLDARAGEAGTVRREVDLQRVLDEVLELLRPEIEARSVKILTGPMPVVLGVEALLGGLLTNLIANALKYGRREHASITIGSQRVGAEWRVTVVDDGQPIAAAEREMIFEPFRRGHHERRARGTGLGLTICRRIVERHGGHIGLLPHENGNCFYFALPA